MVEIIFLAFALYGFGFCTGYVAGLLTPKKIQITDETIICTADKFTDSRFISAVNKVYDYGDFYFISFVFGNISEKYVCQKNLLSKGTLDQFEKIFEPKLVKK